MTPRLLPLVCLAAACGTSDSPSRPKTLAFEAVSPPQQTSRDVFVGGSGDVVVMAHRISRDGGATWADLDPRIAGVTRVAVTGQVVALYAQATGLARWDLATDQITPVAGTPSIAGERLWRLDPASGRFFVFDAVNNAIYVEGGGRWSTAALPQPTATETMPYIYDLESNGRVVMTVSAWGVHRSRDGGATWQAVGPAPGAGRDFLVLADHRFLLFGGATSYLYDDSGAPVTTLPGMTAEQGDASACDDGAIVVHDKVSRDQGKTWQPLLSGGDLAPIVERVGCAGPRYWVLARSDAWGYHLASITAGGPALAAGNWEGNTAWNLSGPPITRTADGTFLVAGLAWRDGDGAWTLREAPARAWTASDMVFGVAKDKLWASHDTGATWAALDANGLGIANAEMLARAPDGALLASSFTTDPREGGGAHVKIWRSTDAGATWTTVFDGRDDEAHRFVGVTSDGAWVATDAISHDGGASWEESNVHNDHSLAFLTPGGRLVATMPTSAVAEDLWRVYDDAGAGPLVATYRLELDGSPAPASVLGTVAFDDAGFAYLAGGAPYVEVWRSTEPLDEVSAP